ncbi:MAG: type IV-A pilus assembly ATPase PilB [Gammaproteobacteria bacterium]|nr:type IV-A pilus assembly ATPase PilB [Gammaproteobacteria bacterium]
MATAPKLTGLARKLILDGLISEETAISVQQQAEKEKHSFIKQLVANNALSAQKIAVAASQEFGIPLIDLSVIEQESLPLDIVDQKLIQKHHALPLFKRGNRLYIGIADPANQIALEEIKFQSGTNTEAILCEIDKLDALIDKMLDTRDTGMEDLMDEDLDDVEFSDEDEHSKEEADTSDIDDTPVVRFVNKVFLDAINKKASDLHFEPYEKRYRVRFRIDGILREVASPPLNMAPRITARIKVMSKMDTSERRIPQDGRIKMNISKSRSIDFRVNTCPTLFGEKIVLRILDASSAQLGIDALGYEEDQKQLYLDALANPYGMILVTGPTGSGKTVSLYTGLNILNTEDTNISTAEDPVEINLEGINQVNVNTKVGLTFSTALRAFLRQDPDIVMVGEIRDLETAEIAIKAAQTGHMVMSTLHTNDAPQTLARLINMGVPPFNIASAVNLIIAQRLGRKLCPECKVVDELPKEALLEEGFTEDDIAAGLTIYKAVGCEQCDDGNKGRVGIYQVMPISEEMGRIIMQNGNAMDLAAQAEKEGIDDLRRSGLKKVKAGVMGLKELNRVTKD